MYRNLGNALGRQQEFDRAEGAYRRAVALRAQLPGQDVELVSLARALREQARHDEAGDALTRAEAVLQRIGAPESPALRSRPRSLART